MNPADVLLSGDYSSLSPMHIPEDDVVSPPLKLEPLTPATGPTADANSELTPEAVARILVAVNRVLGIDLGDLDYAQFIITDSDDEDDSDRDRDGKRECTHIQLVCEACGYIIIAVSKAVAAVLAEIGNDVEARNGIHKRKRGGILGFKELAAKAKLSPWHFHRVFRSITEVTPKAYGEACWDYLLQMHGFDVESKSPAHPEKSLNAASAPASGRVSKAGSRSRSRSRPRHSSQTQQQVLSALTHDEGVRKNRSRSAARSSSFSSRFIPDFNMNDPSLRVSQPIPAPQVSPNSALLASHAGSVPTNNGFGVNLSNISAPGPLAAPVNAPVNVPMQQPLSFLPQPPGTVSGSIGQDYLYMDPPNMYDNFFTDPYSGNIQTPQLDGTVESTPSTGLETIPDDMPATSFEFHEMPDMNALTLSKEYDLKQDPPLAPLVADQEFSPKFVIDEDFDSYTQRGMTPDFTNAKLMDPMEEPSLFRIEY